MGRREALNQVASICLLCEFKPPARGILPNAWPLSNNSFSPYEAVDCIADNMMNMTKHFNIARLSMYDKQVLTKSVATLGKIWIDISRNSGAVQYAAYYHKAIFLLAITRGYLLVERLK